MTIKEMREELEKRQAKLNVAEQFEERITTSLNWFMNYNSELEKYEMPAEDDYSYEAAVMATDLVKDLCKALEKWVKA